MIPSPPPPTVVVRSRDLWLVPLLVFVLALLVTALLLLSVTRSIEAKNRAAFESEVTRTTDAVRERLDTTVTLLHGTAGLFSGSRTVTRPEFAAYVGQLRLRQRYPGILGIGYTERILPAAMEQRESDLRADGMPGFRVWPAEPPRPEYHSIVYLEPMDERNAAAIGYDMFTDAVRREAMARARDQGQPAASGKVSLVQEIDARKQAGLLIYLPLYRGGGVPGTVEARRELLQGFVYSPLRAGDLLQGVRGGSLQLLDYELYDGTDPRPEALLLSTVDPQPQAPAMAASRRIQVAGRTWLLRFGTRPAFDALSQRRLVPWLAAASFATAVLLAWITFVQARARRDAEAAAAQRRLNELALQASQERERERAERLQQLYAEVREGDRRKDEFLAVLAHELRNPLAPLRTSLEILRRVQDGPRAERAREVAERRVAQMVRLIDDLLDVSRISRGKIALQRQRVSLASVIDAAVETSLPLIEKRRHELVRGPVDPAVELEVDPARVAQIFTNLLNNAAHYTPEGGRIEVAADTAGGDEVRVAIRDNGIGIEPDKLRQVFGLFVQAQRSPAGGGLGIGLSLAARLAELHGGRIEAHSGGPGCGAEFVVILPRRPGPATPGTAQESAESAVGVTTGGS